LVDNVLGHINEVNQCCSWLALGWVTIDNWKNHLHPGQLSLAIPAWEGAVSASESASESYGIKNTQCNALALYL